MLNVAVCSEPRRNGTETDGKETPVVGRVAGEAKVDTGKNPCGQQFFSNVNVARRLSVWSCLYLVHHDVTRRKDRKVNIAVVPATPASRLRYGLNDR